MGQRITQKNLLLRMYPSYFAQVSKDRTARLMLRDASGWKVESRKKYQPRALHYSSTYADQMPFLLDGLSLLVQLNSSIRMFAFWDPSIGTKPRLSFVYRHHRSALRVRWPRSSTYDHAAKALCLAYDSLHAILPNSDTNAITLRGHHRYHPPRTPTLSPPSDTNATTPLRHQCHIPPLHAVADAPS